MISRKMVVITSSSILTPSPTWRFTYVLLQSLSFKFENLTSFVKQRTTWGGHRSQWCCTGSLLCIQSTVGTSLASLLHRPGDYYYLIKIRFTLVVIMIMIIDYDLNLCKMSSPWLMIMIMIIRSDGTLCWWSSCWFERLTYLTHPQTIVRWRV